MWAGRQAAVDHGQPVGEDQNRLETLAERFLPAAQPGQIVVGDPVFPVAASARAVVRELASFDVDQPGGSRRPIDEYIEGLDAGAGEDGLLALIHSDVGQPLGSKVVQEGSLVVDVRAGSWRTFTERLVRIVQQRLDGQGHLRSAAHVFDADQVVIGGILVDDEDPGGLSAGSLFELFDERLALVREHGGHVAPAQLGGSGAARGRRTTNRRR